MLSKMREMSRKMQAFPTAFVMTSKTWQEVKNLVKAEECIGENPRSSLMDAFSGTPVEVYETPAELLARLRCQGKDERLMLVTDAHELTEEEECLEKNHPE